MITFETTSITVAHRQRCEDRVKVLDFDEGVVIVVADGVSSTGAGEQAAETVNREVTDSASLEHDAKSWCEILCQTDFRISADESTCVVVARSAKGIVGASAGDSTARLLQNDDLIDLTRNQLRKPLLGSGELQTVGFTWPPSQALLLVGTDCFCNYVRRETLLMENLRIEFVVLARRLVEMVRLPSGELWEKI